MEGDFWTLINTRSAVRRYATRMDMAGWPVQLNGCLSILDGGAEGRVVVCTENLIRVDDAMESPKLAE